MNKINQRTGIELLLKRYKAIFRVAENLNYYSHKDYELAEKKFLKYALFEGKVEIR